jgi:hypothetical protein
MDFEKHKTICEAVSAENANVTGTMRHLGIRDRAFGEIEWKKEMELLKR